MMKQMIMATFFYSSSQVSFYMTFLFTVKSWNYPEYKVGNKIAEITFN